jgi:hypothetical protein
LGGACPSAIITIPINDTQAAERQFIIKKITFNAD